MDSLELSAAESNKLSVLCVNASMRSDGSSSRRLTAKTCEALSAHADGVSIMDRDLAKTDIPFVSEAWIGANFTDEAERSDAQKQTLALSDMLIDELMAADIIVIGLPIYNFGVPAAMKAWIDMVCRARKTFRYSPEGPVGLLEGKKAIVCIASGGTKMDSAIDFTTPYIRHVLGFIGIHDVEVIAADGSMSNPDAVSDAEALIEGTVAKTLVTVPA